MIGPIYATARGAVHLQMRLDAISNNLANVSTVGFKRTSVVFHDVGLEVTSGGAPQPPSSREREQVPLSGFPYTLTDFTPGSMKKTGNPLDFAIEGDGFFCVETPQGLRYTRDGSFIINQNKELATKEGYPVQGDSGRILLEGGQITADDQGGLWVDGVETGKLKIVRFPDPPSILREGESLFSGEGAVAAEDIRLFQGFLEHSNVNPIRTMTEMVEVLRGFESYQKILQALNEVSTKMIQEVSK